METLTVDQVLVFATICEEGSFSAAARRLGRVQSAISYAVAQMEESLELRLFDRSGRLPVPTAAAKALLPDAWALLERLTAIRRRARSIAGGIESEVAIAIDSLLPASSIYPALRCFQNSFPSTRLVLREETLGAIPSLVESGQCAFGVSAGYPGSDAMAGERLGSVLILSIVGSEHPLASIEGIIGRDELVQHTQIVVRDRSDKSAGKDHGVYSSTTWRVGDFRSKLELIEAGFGFGGVPQHLCRDAIVEGRVRVLALPERREGLYEVPIYGLTMRSQVLGPAGSWLREEIWRAVESWQESQGSEAWSDLRLRPGAP